MISKPNRVGYRAALPARCRLSLKKRYPDPVATPVEAFDFEH